MKITIKEVNNPFQSASKQNIPRYGRHYPTMKKPNRISIIDTLNYDENDNDEDNNYYENILKRINDSDKEELQNNINSTTIFPKTPSSTKSKHLKITYSMSKRKKEKSSKTVHTAIHNSKKLTKTFLLEVNKDEEKEKSESNLHQKKLNIINEENGEDITLNANSKISFKKNSKSSLENFTLRPQSNKNTKKVQFNIETATQIEIHPVKIDKPENNNNNNILTLSLNNQIENTSSHTTNKPINQISPSNKVIKISVHSHNSTNSNSSQKQSKKKKNFLCCIPIISKV